MFQQFLDREVSGYHEVTSWLNSLSGMNILSRKQKARVTIKEVIHWQVVWTAYGTYKVFAECSCAIIAGD